jgi:hypothetical protein
MSPGSRLWDRTTAADAMQVCAEIKVRSARAHVGSKRISGLAGGVKAVRRASSGNNATVRCQHSARSLRPLHHRSISPNTMSSEPMIAETSASMCPRLKKSMASRWANEGARILHLYGRLVPSATR